MSVKTFREIIAWQKAHALALDVCRVTEDFPKKELFVLTSQIRRCAISVPSNIAEGFKRRGKNETIHFYNIGEASLEELKYQLLLSKDLGYITDSVYQIIHEKAEEVGRLIHGWIKSQQ